MRSNDILQKPFSDICDLYKMYSRSRAKSCTIATGNKFAAGVIRAEIGSLLENFKVDILSTFSNQLEALKTKRSQEEENSLASFCSKCR